MTLADIALTGALFLVLRFAPPRARLWGLFVVGALAVFWLQPLLPVRYLDFWLPFLTLALTAFCWLVVTPPDRRGGRENLLAGILLAALAAAVALTRFLSLEGLVTASRPPPILQAAAALVLAGGAAFLLLRASFPSKKLLAAGVLLLLALFVFLKHPALSAWLSAQLRTLMAQSAAGASAVDLRWLGYSYLAFRLIHVLRDTRERRLRPDNPPASLAEFTVYALFPPALTAGPIDRLERFSADLRQPADRSAEGLARAGERIALGLLKKFVLADLLASAALSPAAAAGAQSTAWLWAMLYAYAFQIYLDFSGYTDIAVGLGLLVGIRLPENFNRPYLQSNLARFWNCWHMTLTGWIRAYAFNPLTRALRRRHLSGWIVLLAGQAATMLLIGLWHGITWNFALWGLWHTAGLFAQNRWSQLAKPLWERLEARPRAKKLLSVGSTLLTFNFVALGWVWFVLPDPALAADVLLRLFGVWR